MTWNCLFDESSSSYKLQNSSIISLLKAIFAYLSLSELSSGETLSLFNSSIN